MIAEMARYGFTSPPGTRFSLTLRSTGDAPSMVHGTMVDPVVSYQGQDAVIQALPTSQTFPLVYGPNSACEGRTVSRPAAVSGVLLLGETSLRGAFFATNAAASGTPTPRGDGAFDVFLTGCGDRDESTLEGFFEGFIPNSALGVAPALAAIADDIVQVVNDGVVQTKVEVDPARRADVVPFGVRVPGRLVPEGVVLSYRLSYSAHTVAVRPDRKLLKAARRCVKRGGEPRVRARKVRCKA